MKPIKAWPENERPREKLLQQGASSLSDAELLAIFLRTGVPGMTAVDLSRELLQRFGGLNAILQSSEDVFCQAKGLGKAKYVQLQAVIEMARRYLFAQMNERECIDDPARAADFLLARMKGYRREVFACIYLDTKHRVIRFEELFSGTLDSASIYPREIVRRILDLNAAAVIFSHNHPSGDPEPSHADIEMTRRLQKALDYLDVRVLDHLVVAEEGAVSLAERGMLMK
ncbi:MAG: JAB domain-containing protein [Gammaproteobacteria bacterium]|nr:MAG: JAB domain-containing protein [Gammaproteobacteria bacterium]